MPGAPSSDMRYAETALRKEAKEHGWTTYSMHINIFGELMVHASRIAEPGEHTKSRGRGGDPIIVEFYTLFKE